MGDGGDTECKIQVCESVRGRDVYIVQSVGSQDNAEERTEFGSVNDHLVELMLIVSAARRAPPRRRGGGARGGGGGPGDVRQGFRQGPGEEGGRTRGKK